MTQIQFADSRPVSSLVANTLKAAMNVLILLLFVLLAVSSYLHFKDSGTMRSFGILAVNTLFVVLYLSRRPAKSETPSLRLWVLAVTGTALPLLMRPSEGPGFTQLGTAIQIAGLAMLAVALVSLSRSFAVVPANRGVRSGGLYRLVRHPIYLSELIVILGVVLSNPTTVNMMIWVCECVLQFARACAEERFLCEDPEYRTYRKRVRYRLIPGLI